MGILDGKAAIITGAGRGIGRGHATRLAANGASVIVNDVDAEEAQSAVSEIAESGGKAALSNHDIGTRDGARELIATLLEYTPETLPELISFTIFAYGKEDLSSP